MSPENEQISARDRLLEVAEAAFFSNGYDATSIRALTEAAGVNLALVNYHFGGKRNLYLEALKRGFRKIAEEKCNSMSRIIASQQPPDIRTILTACVDMYLGSDETVTYMQNFLRLIARQVAEDNDALELLSRELIMPTHQLIKDAICKIYPEMRPEEVSFHISSVIGQTFHYIRSPETYNLLAGIAEHVNLRETIAQHIIDFSLRGFQQETPCE